MRGLPGWAARGLGEARLPWEALEHVRHLDLDAVGDPVPRGDGSPVLVVPGFGFGDVSVLPLILTLHRYGWRPISSRILANVACSDRTVDRLIARLEPLVAERGRRVAVIGQSRGGMLARGVMARRPDLAHRAVSLGGALNDEFAFYEIPRPLVGVLKAVHSLDPELRERRCVTPQCDCPYMQAVHRPLPGDVELVSIYSKQDGVLDWRSCVVAGAVNVEVPGSHLGMGVNPHYLRAALAGLARPTVEP